MADKAINTYILPGVHRKFEMAIMAGIALTAVGALLLNKVLKECIWPMKEAHGSKAQIIEIDEYEILDDNQDQDSRGYRVKIDSNN